MNTFTLAMKIDKQQVCDLLASAFEGGSNYWYMITSKRGFPKGAFLSDLPKYHDACLQITDEAVGSERQFAGKTFTLDGAAIVIGLQRMAVQAPVHFGDFIADRADATTADVFLQLCLFEEVIYG